MRVAPKRKLVEYMHREGIGVAELAIRLGISRGYAYVILDERPGHGLVPGLALARTIERVTGIPANHWDYIATTRRYRPRAS